MNVTKFDPTRLFKSGTLSILQNVLSLLNRPLLSSKNLHFQNEAKCATFLVKIIFIYMRMKNYFHIKG